MKDYLKIEYLYILLVLAHEPLFKFVLKVDGSGRSTLAFTFLILFILYKKGDLLNVTFRKPVVIWFIWAVYAFVNSLINGYGDDSMPVYSIFLVLIVPVVLMTLIVVLYKKDYRRLLTVLICSMYLGIFVILLFNRSAAFEEGRYGGEGMNSNTIGIMNVVLLMFIYLKYLIKDLTIKHALLIGALPVIIIIMTGSKTAFGGLLFVILSHFLVNRSNSTIKNSIYFSFISIFLFFAINFVINNTVVGDRITRAADTGEELGFDTGSAVLDKFGDRGIYYYLGWQFFKKDPLFGIGLGKFKIFSDLDYTLHTEYMIQLTELGLIGFILFVFFYYTVFKKLIQKKGNQQTKKLKEIYLAYVIILLAMITATRMYNQWYLFAVVGLAIGFVENQRRCKVITVSQ